MTFEVVSYITMAAGAYLALMFKKKAWVYGWAMLFLVYSIAIRVRAPALDMINYAAALEVWPPPITAYELREPVVWLGLAALGTLIRNRVLVFVLIDLVTCIATIWAFRRLDDGSDRLFSMAPTVLTSFVFLFGVQNVFRQHIAFVIFLCSVVACAAGTTRRAVMLFLLSGLTHNGVVLLFGYWWDAIREHRSQVGWVVTALGVGLLAVVIDLVAKSSSATGANTVIAYVGVSAAMGVLLMYSMRGRGVLEMPLSPWRNYVALLPAVAFLGEAQFERVSMMYMVLMVIAMARHSAVFRIRWRVLANVTYVVLVVPVLVFPSAWNILHT